MRFTKKTEPVEAFQFFPDEPMGGVVKREDGTFHAVWEVGDMTIDRQLHPGDWIVCRDGKVVCVYHRKEFEEEFTPVCEGCENLTKVTHALLDVVYNLSGGSDEPTFPVGE